MNPNLILQAAQQPDIVGAIDRGTQAAMRTGGAMRENALANLYRTQGPGIMQGDPNALAALAQFDPNAALGVQQTRMSIEEARAAGARAAAAEAQRIGAARAQAEAAKGQRFLRIAQAALTAGDMQSYSMAVRELAGTDVSPDDFPVLAAGIEGGIEAIIGTRDALAPPQPEVPAAMQALQMRAREAGLQPGTPEYQQFMLNGGTQARGTALSIGPDGSVQFREGVGASGVTFTEGQSKDNVYATRAQGALASLDGIDATLTNRAELMAEMVPLGFGRQMQSPEFQQAWAASREFLQAILRKDTGAAITTQEVEEYGRVYLPQPGDTPQMLEWRRQARQRALEALQSGMNEQQLQTVTRALSQSMPASAGGAAPSPTQAGGTGAQPQGGAATGAFRDADLSALGAVDVNSLSGEDLRAFNARMRELLAQ